MIQESSQSLHRLLVEWETCQNPDYLGKSKNWRQTYDPEMSKSNMDCWGNQAEIRLFKELYTLKMGVYDPGMSIQYRLGDHPIRHTSPFENPVSKKASTTFLKWFPILTFFGKKRGEIIGPGPGQKEIQIPQKKLVKSGLTLFPSSAYYWFLMRYPKENDLYGYPLKMY